MPAKQTPNYCVRYGQTFNAGAITSRPFCPKCAAIVKAEARAKQESMGARALSCESTRTARCEPPGEDRCSRCGAPIKGPSIPNVARQCRDCWEVGVAGVISLPYAPGA